MNKQRHTLPQMFVYEFQVRPKVWNLSIVACSSMPPLPRALPPFAVVTPRRFFLLPKTEMSRLFFLFCAISIIYSLWQPEWNATNDEKCFLLCFGPSHGVARSSMSAVRHAPWFFYGTKNRRILRNLTLRNPVFVWVKHGFWFYSINSLFWTSTYHFSTNKLDIYWHHNSFSRICNAI